MIFKGAFICNQLFLKILSTLCVLVIARHEFPEWNNQWPIVSLNDGWNDYKVQSSEWNYQNPTGWREFDNNNAWEEAALIPIKKWHYQEPILLQQPVKSIGWTNNCVTKKPRYLHTEVIYPKVITNNNEWNYNNEWTSNNRKPSNNEWSRDFSHEQVW